MTEPGEIIYVNLADLRFYLLFCEHCEEHSAAQDTVQDSCSASCSRCGEELRVAAGPMDFGELDDFWG